MALCPGGTRAKATTPPIVVAGIDLLVGLAISRIPYVGPFLSIVEPIVFEGSVVCNGDPPSFDPPNATDLIEAGFGRLTQNMRNMFLNVLWYQFCECADVPTPVAPVITPPPNLPIYVPGPVLPCDELTVEYSETRTGDVNEFEIYGSAAAPRGLPAGVTDMKATVQIVSVGSAPTTFHSYQFVIRFLNAAGTLIDARAITCSQTAGVAGLPTTLSFSVDPAAVSWYILFVNPQDGTTVDQDGVAQLAVQSFCGVKPGRTQTDCCPPDPALIARINQIQIAIDQVLARLGLQGPLEVLASIAVTGEGLESIPAGARQVHVALTTLGQGVQLVPYANPDRLMRAATLRFGNPFGWRRREHIDAQSNIFAVPADSNIVSWSIHPGTSGTLTFLGEAST
jgi:hypothetical protein